MADGHEDTVAEVVRLLRGGSAHINLKDALKDLPANARGVIPNGLPYSIWQLVEHIRIVQWDMLEFSRSASHRSPKWPDEYWPAESEPTDDAAWEASLRQIDPDLDTFISLFTNADIHEPIAHGEGQTLLREALQIADHTAYHTSEIVVIRRLLGNYKG